MWEGGFMSYWNERYPGYIIEEHAYDIICHKKQKHVKWGYSTQSIYAEIKEIYHCSCGIDGDCSCREKCASNGDGEVCEMTILGKII